MKKLIFILALIAYTVMQVYCEDDKSFIGDVNNDGREDLVLPKLSDFSKATVIAHSNHLPDNKSTGIITILLSYLNSYYLRGCHTGVAPA